MTYSTRRRSQAIKKRAMNSWNNAVPGVSKGRMNKRTGLVYHRTGQEPVGNKRGVRRYFFGK